MAWQNSKKITALWANNEANNAWAWIDGLGWRECDWRNNTTNLLILAAHAKATNSFVDLNEEAQPDQTLIVEMYVW
jgi:hypothetical protein